MEGELVTVTLLCVSVCVCVCRSGQVVVVGQSREEVFASKVRN